jgi:hypothetical protein
MKIFLIANLLLIATITHAQITTKGLVAYYSFSGNALDSSGYINNGTVYGAKLTTDRFNKDSCAYLFNGTSDYIEVPNSKSLQSPKNKLTMSAWVFVIDTSLRHYIIDKRLNYSSSSPYDSYCLISTNNSIIKKQYWQVATGTTPVKHLQGTSEIKIGVWYHVVSVYNGRNLKIYINGKLEGKIKKKGKIQYSNMPLYIGTAAKHPEHFMNGKIDDIRIYNRNLKKKELKELFSESNTNG